MTIDITGRQIEVTPALRDFTEDKLKKLERLLDGPFHVHVILNVEKHRHHAEIQVKSRTALLSGQAETEDLYASIAEVADKIERQAHKHKEKTTERRRRDGRRLEEEGTAHEASEPADGVPRIIPSERYRLKPLSPEDAVLELEAQGEDLLVYRDAQSYRVNVVYRRPDGHFGLVDPEF